MSSESDEKISPVSNWSEETHSNDVEPNYDVVFPENEVKQMTITISPENWAAMQSNMVELFDGAGNGGNRPGELAGGGQAGERPEIPAGNLPGENMPPENDERPGIPPGDIPEGNMPPNNGVRPGMPEGGMGGRDGGGDMTTENPIWVTATIEFDGYIWENVGVRYKGNSSLSSGWASGTSKLPLKLDFDEFEDEYPEIENQRFYGFKQLSLSNAYKDTSFLRDAAVSQILEDAGLPVAQTAFYEISLDYGEGPVVLGLYIAIEVIDDTVLEHYFGNDDGNIYDADGTAASFAESAYEKIEVSFEKENNSDSDWSDIETLYAILHSDQRTLDPVAWRAELESVFDTDIFLNWLAITAIIQNWDAYGVMSHNYYLYNNPETGQLTWISWDHNEAISVGGSGGRNRTVSLDQSTVNENWPLIRYLLDDPVYYEQYLNYLAETIAGPFNPEQMAEKYQTMANLIAPYATAEVGEEAFDQSIQALINYTYERADAVAKFLAEAEE